MSDAATVRVNADEATTIPAAVNDAQMNSWSIVERAYAEHCATLAGCDETALLAVSLKAPRLPSF